MGRREGSMEEILDRNNLTIVYYTSNYLDDKKPAFLEATRKQLVSVTRGCPIITVSQKPMTFGTNICVGNIGRSHLNLYKQILIGCQAATTKYVALAEDDVLYSTNHFFDHVPSPRTFAYNMCKWSLYTWVKPPMYAFKHRAVINSLIGERDLFVASLEERFAKYPDPATTPLIFWADFGRLENHLGVTVRKTEEYYSKVPNIVFSHDNAFGYLLLGKHKKLDYVRAYDIPIWGKAYDILKLYET